MSETQLEYLKPSQLPSSKKVYGIFKGRNKTPPKWLRRLLEEPKRKQNRQEIKTIWCPYCCEPLAKYDDLKKTWAFQSGKGGLRFYAYLYQCPRCTKKVRLTYTEKEERP